MSEETATENVTQMEPRKKSKVELKREEIFRERMRRLINTGKTAEQAFTIIQREDYERMPISDKLELMRTSFGQSLDGVANDIQQLHENQKDLADVMDVNFRGFGRLLVKLGISEADQVAVLKECEDEVRAERLAAQAAAQAAREEAEKKELEKSVDQAGPAQVPEGAQVFGG